VRSIREGLAGFRRAPLLGSLSITSIGLSLLIIGLFALSAHNIDRALSDVEERVEVVGYLIEDAGEDRVRVARQEIAGYPEVDEVRYVSKVEALFDASRDLPEFSDVFSDLDVNPLPASLELTFNEGFRNPDHVAAVAERLSTYEFIDDVRYGQGWVERIFALRRLAGGGALILGGAFAGVAVLLIATAVRMAILARSEEIEIMQTVGATEGYIQRPFLVEGLVTGLLGGGLALGLTRIGYVLITRSFLPLEWLPDLWIVGGIAAAGLLGMIAAGYAVRRELGKSYAL
jgi:cell division transport system permease protein